MIEDFGIIIACCDQDFAFAKGCCASIRYFLGDVPICLIVDGKFSTLPLERVYGVEVISQQNISSEILRKRSFGFGLTKMIAFWESPWKYFLYLDADTIVWFNLLKFANFKDFDVIIDKPRYARPDEDISNYFFDIQKIEKYFPDFNWEAYRNHYFCTGVFFAKRDIFSLDEYVEILDLISHEPKMFYPGEQGFLNFMLCRAAQKGKIRLEQKNLQLLVPDFEREIFEKKFPIDKLEPLYTNEDVVIHWCGPNKPNLSSNEVYSKPMTFCRQKFIFDAWSDAGIKADIRMKIEDIQLYLMRYKNKFFRKTKAFKNLLAIKH